MRLLLVAVLLAIVGALLSEMGWRYGRLYSVIVVVLLLSGIGESLSYIFLQIYSLEEFSAISEAAKCALKILGIGYVFSFGTEIVRGLGEEGIARVMAVVERCEILLLVLPYLEEILSFGFSVL